MTVQTSKMNYSVVIGPTKVTAAKMNYSIVLDTNTPEPATANRRRMVIAS